MSSPAPVRVVVRLPWERPDDAQDPTPIEWNAQKADILWKTIEKSRSSNNQAMDWKALSAKLDVPLPYLLYRAHTRFQEELRGIQSLQAVAQSPTIPPAYSPESPMTDIKASVATRMGSGSGRMSSPTSSRLTATPMGVRARLTSLGHNSQRTHKNVSSSTITVQAPQLNGRTPLRPPSPASSSDTDSDEETTLQEEAAERAAEEEEMLNKKLKDLQQLVKDDGLGFVTRPRDQQQQQQQQQQSRQLSESKELNRGRPGGTTSSNPDLLRREVVSEARSASHSLSTTSESSPQGSIPDIPSPSQSNGLSQSHQSQSSIPRHMSPPIKSSSPPALSPRSALGHSHRRYSSLMDHYGSSNGSEASSFSDISDASLSASVLESALMSNIRGGGSRFSSYARNRLAQVGRSNSGHAIVPH